MQPTLDVRRHADGSIDLDFYRRRAMRRRRLARRTFVKHGLAAARRMARASVLLLRVALKTDVFGKGSRRAQGTTIKNLAAQEAGGA
jgi:hypothetical protein